jgi:hypothetical protein
MTCELEKYSFLSNQVQCWWGLPGDREKQLAALVGFTTGVTLALDNRELSTELLLLVDMLRAEVYGET